ncbi:hypothetical protein, partial [Streptomyces lasiicapitis]|uniref:hypothetical protein n=1 Tax=Streptomyces lasiicapitis TaxID=1923961 RepID=UPI00369075FB
RSDTDHPRAGHSGSPGGVSRPAAPEPICGAPAVWHVAWRFTAGVGDFSLLCGPHMAMAERDLVYADRHPSAVACDMPGTGWLHATPSRCVPASSEDLTRDDEIVIEFQTETPAN